MKRKIHQLIGPYAEESLIHAKRRFEAESCLQSICDAIFSENREPTTSSSAIQEISFIIKDFQDSHGNFKRRTVDYSSYEEESTMHDQQ